MPVRAVHDAQPAEVKEEKGQKMQGEGQEWEQEWGQSQSQSQRWNQKQEGQEEDQQGKEEGSTKHI